MKLPKPKELLHLVKGKIYVMKYIKGSVPDSQIWDLLKMSKHMNITIIALPVKTMDSVKFEVK